MFKLDYSIEHTALILTDTCGRYSV